jgi:AcrR family transcriptional regulator
MLVTNIPGVGAGEHAPGRAERTRARLIAVALDLFERQGYDQTTVAQIADAAGVTPMTVFRHFPSKDSLVIADPYDPVMASAVAAQPRTLPPLIRVAAGVRGSWQRLPEPATQTVRRRVRIAAATPSLRGAIAANNATTEAILADQLIADGADALVARVAAAAVLAGLTAALLEWSRQRDMSLDAAIAKALDTLEASSG